MLNPRKNSTRMLFYEAKRCQTCGWSVIPLLGNLDSDRAKLPAIKWGRYQHTRAQPHDLEDWFLEQGFGGLGIVCGRVSRLVVLDFDDPMLASDFRRLYPHLTETRMVLSGTRGLPHYYFHVPEQLKVYSRSVRGVDLRADGTYVVAPPTQVGDACWRLIQEKPLHVLSLDDLKAILRFFAETTPELSENPLNVPSRLILGHLEGRSDSLNSVRAHRISEAAQAPVASSELCAVHSRVSVKRRISDGSCFDLVALYQKYLSEGRNNALFRVACLARDAGWSQPDVEKVLLDVHASQPDLNGYCELFQVRYLEAQRTIQSAFNGLPRKLANESANQIRRDYEGVGNPTDLVCTELVGLSNRVREELLAQGLAGAARVLDGLYLAGLRPNTFFTERQACELLKSYRIGRRSIMAALRVALADDLPLFTREDKPLHTTPKEAGAAKDQKAEEKKCLESWGAKRVKTPGRPPTTYVLPGNVDLAQRLGVVSGSADFLNGDDFASPASYRRALHRELIKRRPGQYSRDWLAERLGISAWTCRRYEAELKMFVQPMYAEETIRWTNVEPLLPLKLENAIPGTFLEDANGKRYPPLRGIAMRLLDEGQSLTYKRRAPNYYAYVPQEAVGFPTPTEMPPGVETGLADRDSNNGPFKSVRHEQDSRSHSQLLDHQNTFRERTDIRTRLDEAQKAVGNPTHPNHQPDPALSQHNTQLSFWLCPDCLKTSISTTPPTACARCGRSDWEHVEKDIWQNQERLKVWWQTRWREQHPSAPRRATPLAEAPTRRKSDSSYRTEGFHVGKRDTATEATALRIHRQVKDLSLRTARQLVDEYGTALVEKGVNLMMRRSNIHNPAGFLITILRSEQKFYSGHIQKPTSKVNVEDAATWLQKMAASPYVRFLSNADEVKMAASQ